MFVFPIPGSPDCDPSKYNDGMMFVCNAQTYKECMDLKLFGLPASYMQQVLSLKQGKSALFLYDTSSRRLHGVFEAASDGGDNINRAAWGAVKKPSQKHSGSPFPAQIEFRVAHAFTALDDASIRSIIRDNQHTHIRKLNTQQVRGLIVEFHKRSQLTMPESSSEGSSGTAAVRASRPPKGVQAGSVMVVANTGDVISKHADPAYNRRQVAKKDDALAAFAFPVQTKENPFQLEPDQLISEVQQITLEQKVHVTC